MKRVQWSFSAAVKSAPGEIHLTIDSRNSHGPMRERIVLPLLSLYQEARDWGSVGTALTMCRRRLFRNAGIEPSEKATGEEVS